MIVLPEKGPPSASFASPARKISLFYFSQSNVAPSARGSLFRWQVASEKRLPFPSASPVCGH